MLELIEGVFMRNQKRVGLLVAVVSMAAFIAAVVASVIVFFEKKKKDDEELERYLECSIQ